MSRLRRKAIARQTRRLRQEAHQLERASRDDARVNAKVTKARRLLEEAEELQGLGAGDPVSEVQL